MSRSTPSITAFSDTDLEGKSLRAKKELFFHRFPKAQARGNHHHRDVVSSVSFGGIIGVTYGVARDVDRDVARDAARDAAHEV